MKPSALTGLLALSILASLLPQGSSYQKAEEKGRKICDGKKNQSSESSKGVLDGGSFNLESLIPANAFSRLAQALRDTINEKLKGEEKQQDPQRPKNRNDDEELKTAKGTIHILMDALGDILIKRLVTSDKYGTQVGDGGTSTRDICITRANLQKWVKEVVGSLMDDKLASTNPYLPPPLSSKYPSWRDHFSRRGQYQYRFDGYSDLHGDTLDGPGCDSSHWEGPSDSYPSYRKGSPWSSGGYPDDYEGPLQGRVLHPGNRGGLPARTGNYPARSGDRPDHGGSDYVGVYPGRADKRTRPGPSGKYSGSRDYSGSEEYPEQHGYRPGIFGNPPATANSKPLVSFNHRSTQDRDAELRGRSRLIQQHHALHGTSGQVQCEDTVKAPPCKLGHENSAAARYIQGLLPVDTLLGGIMETNHQSNSGAVIPPVTQKQQCSNEKSNGQILENLRKATREQNGGICPEDIGKCYIPIVCEKKEPICYQQVPCPC